MLTVIDVVKMKKGGFLLWIIVGFFAIIFYALAIILIFGSHININIGLSLSTEELKALPTFNKIIYSEDCLSTGTLGVLNSTKLDDVDGGGELDCAYLPGLGYSVKVEDLDTGKEWEFGYNGFRKKEYGDSLVLIRYPDGTIHNGRIKFYKFYSDPVVKSVYAAEKAWISSESVTVELRSEKKIIFKKNKVCYEKEDVHHCRKLLNSKLNIDDKKVFDPMKYKSVTFKKVATSSGIKLEVEFNRIPVMID
ncbi:MAG: hypothetical protein J7L45_00365 [Candidatus Aenigmarchaeota archaeon]|nr:hypothetical protein [Candidatus Aenigmarchaeota archaeon]